MLTDGKLSGDVSGYPRDAAEIIVESDAMRALIKEAEAFADCDSSVMIAGETGVGKEMVARLLHRRHSRYGQGPFVAVNCGAIPDGLFESHFFGHVKGAFTGAVMAHKGYFEQAEGGTLFLDEIGDLPLHQQVKLLRVLEQSSVTRLGATNNIGLDFRLVAATNRNLGALVLQGLFRSDLYYRIAVIELRLPSLEERGAADKLAIFRASVRQLFERGSHKRGSPQGTPTIPAWLLDRVAHTHFPGNVRELRNLAERVTVIRRQLGDWDRTAIDHVFASMLELAPARKADVAIGNGEQAERERVLEALEINHWRRRETAAFLHIGRKALWEKMRRLRIDDGRTEE